MLIRRVLLHGVKAGIALFILSQLYSVVMRINKLEHDELRIWENIFAQIYKVQKLSLIKNEFLKDEYNVQYMIK